MPADIQDAPIIIPAWEDGQFETVIRYAIIRLGVDNEWNYCYYHSNDHSSGGHARVGIDGWGEADRKVELDDIGDMVVRGLGAVTGEKVVKLSCSLDESISRLGVRAGGSGGATKCTIKLWKDGVRVSPRSSMFAGDLCNLWFHSVAVRPQQGPSIMSMVSTLSGLSSRMAAVEAMLAPLPVELEDLKSRIAALEAA
jgi:hypothetical protein